MKKLILALATAITLFAGNFVLPSTANAQPSRYWGGPYFGGQYGYQPSYYRHPRNNRDSYGPRVYRYARPDIYQGGPQAGVYTR